MKAMTHFDRTKLLSREEGPSRPKIGNTTIFMTTHENMALNEGISDNAILTEGLLVVSDGPGFLYHSDLTTR